MNDCPGSGEITVFTTSRQKTTSSQHGESSFSFDFTSPEPFRKQKPIQESSEDYTNKPAICHLQTAGEIENRASGYTIGTVYQTVRTRRKFSDLICAVIALTFLLSSLSVTGFELTPSIREYADSVSGTTAELPCKLPSIIDRPSLVLWYKDYSTKPFYSFDAREALSGNGRHKVHQEWERLGRRANFTFSPSTFTKEASVIGTLWVKNVTLADAGNFTCRVDFYTAQTVMTLLTLNVFEKVRRINVVDENGREVGSEAGPYTSRQILKLVCTARGGFPAPNVVWMMDGIPLPKSSSTAYYHHPYSESHASDIISNSHSEPSSSINLPNITSNEILTSLPLQQPLSSNSRSPNFSSGLRGIRLKAFHSPSARSRNYRNKSRSVPYKKTSSPLYTYFPPVRLERKRHFSNFHYPRSYLSNTKIFGGSFHYHLPYSRKSFSQIESRKEQLNISTEPKKYSNKERDLEANVVTTQVDGSLEQLEKMNKQNKSGSKRSSLKNMHYTKWNLVDENSFDILSDKEKLSSSMVHVEDESNINNSSQYNENMTGFRHISGTIQLTGDNLITDNDLNIISIKHKRSIISQNGFEPLGNEERDGFKYFEHNIQSSFEIDDSNESYQEIINEENNMQSKSSVKNRRTKDLKSNYDSQSIEEEVEESKVASVLEIGPLTRNDNGKVFSCWARNSKLTTSKTRHVKITMNLPPTVVTIKTPTVGGVAGIDGVVGVMADRESVLTCEAEGSVPPADIRWTPSSLVTPLSSQPSLDQNTTLSRARILATADDDGRVVTCTATNPVIRDYTLTATHALQVKYPPIVEAHLAPALDPNSIKEGDDVYFECRVKSNPPVGSVVWLHEGEPLTPGRYGNKSHVLLHGHNLVLQDVTRLAKGAYICRASNALGSVSSSPAELNIMYPPVCLDAPNQTIAIAPGQPTTLVCKVDSYPKQVKFRWAVNTSRGLSHLDPTRFTSNGTLSYLVYKPQMTLSEEAEKKRNIYYINKKLGFYGSSDGASSGGQRSLGGNKKKFKESNVLRTSRDTNSVLPSFTNSPNSNSNDQYISGLQTSKWYDASDYNTLSNMDKKREFPREVHDENGIFGTAGRLEIRKKNLAFEQSDASFSRKSGDKMLQYFGGDKSGMGPKREKDSESDDTLFIGLEETYGVVYCWGENMQGKQQQPCVMTITPAGPPSPIRQCRIFNQTAAALQVVCRPGSDGGLTQTFAATAIDERTGAIVDNVTSSHPLLTLRGLETGIDYIVKVWAYNSRGASEPFVLDGYALKVAENKIDNTEDNSQSKLPAIFVLLVAVFFLLIGFVIMYTKLKSRRRRRRPTRSESDDGPKTSVSENDDEDNNKPNGDDQISHDFASGQTEPDIILRADEEMRNLFYHMDVNSQTSSSPFYQPYTNPSSAGIPLSKPLGQNSRLNPPVYHLESSRVPTGQTILNTGNAKVSVNSIQLKSGHDPIDTVITSKDEGYSSISQSSEKYSKLDKSKFSELGDTSDYSQVNVPKSIISNTKSKKVRENSSINTFNMTRTSSFDIDANIDGKGGKVPFTGSIVTRDPPFHYATICRGYSVSKNDDSDVMLENGSKRNLHRGRSSQDLLPITDNRYQKLTHNFSPSKNKISEILSPSKKLLTDCSKNRSKITTGREVIPATGAGCSPISFTSPVQSVVDLPKVVAGSNKYYTLKISNTRHNNESFV